MANASLISDQHAEMLATKWWSGKKFRRHGVPLQEGAFTQAESDDLNRAIHDYRESHNLNEEDADDIVFGETRADGFWEHVARAVPGRRVRSVYDHVRAEKHPFRDQGKWTDVELLRLNMLRNKGLSWANIGDALQRSSDVCRNRYHKHMARQRTGSQGAWSVDEESHLIQVMRDLNELGKKPTMTPKFWVEVSELMGNTRSPNQCLNKWSNSLSPIVKDLGRAPRWRDADTKLLVQKVASLDLDTEDAIRWNELISERWNRWTPRKIQARWVALKKKVNTTGLSHREVVQSLLGRYHDTRASMPVTPTS